MYCKKCGKEIKNNQKFCSHCGAQILESKQVYLNQDLNNKLFKFKSMDQGKVEITLNDLGMNIAEAVTIFLKQVVMTDSIPFIIRKPKLNAETIKAMEDAKKGKNLSKGYTDLDEMWGDLEQED